MLETKDSSAGLGLPTDTANWTRGDSSANTPKTSGTKEDEPLWSEAEEEVKHARSKLSKFVPGQQQFPTMSQPELNSEHALKYLGVMSGKTLVSLFDSYTKSIDQPWQQTPYHEQQLVWKETLAGMQQLSHVFHKLKLKGWPNYLSYIKGRHPMYSTPFSAAILGYHLVLKEMSYGTQNVPGLQMSRDSGSPNDSLTSGPSKETTTTPALYTLNTHGPITLVINQCASPSQMYYIR